MKLRTKLLAIVLFVGILPLSVSAWVILGIHQRSQARSIADLHSAMAARGAERVTHRLATVASQLERLVAQSIQWSTLSPEEQQAALWLLYRQDEDIVVASLVGSGALLGGSAYVSEQNVAEAPGHLPGSPKLASDLLLHLPSQHGPSGSAVFGKVFRAEAGRFPVIPVVLQVAAADGDVRLRVAVALSLRGLCGTESRTVSGVTVSLLDSELRTVCPTRSAPALTPASPALRKTLHAAGTHPFVSATGETQLLTHAEADNGFQVVVTQPMREADAAGSAMRNYALLWITISIAISLVSGWLLSKGILAPVARLLAGAKQLAGGNLAYRLEMPEKDELGQLGQAFNDMAKEIEARELQIRSWNQELQERVKERTRAIELYHQRLVYMEKAGVTASLSAGVATEINDPLTGVLGALQLVVTRMRQDPTREHEVRLLSNAETGAQQIRRLVKRMQDLSQRQPRSQLRPFRAQDLVSGALTELAPDLKTNGVEVVQSFAKNVPPVLGNFTQLEQALVQVLTNAITACLKASCAATSRVSTETDTRKARPPEPAVEDPSAGGRGEAGGAGGASDRGLETRALARRGRGRARGRIMIVVRPEPQKMVEIAVADNGIGIPEQDLARIFEPFVALGEPRGTGLGLTVARHIVEEHGGTLSAVSDGTNGATFYIRIPEAEGV